MYTNKQGTTSAADLRLFGNVRVLTISALLIAMSIVLGKLLAFNITDSIRISLENLPLLMAGIFFGPFIGAAVGAGADIIGCLIVGYSINPIISVGAASIGFIAGFVSHFIFKKRSLPSIAVSVAAAHIIGSMISSPWDSTSTSIRRYRSCFSGSPHISESAYWNSTSFILCRKTRLFRHSLTG